MTEIITNRLAIMPMTDKELAALIKSHEQTAPELSAAYREMLDSCVRHPEARIWYAPWKICLCDKTTAVGYAGFKGLIDGYTEIGYGINEEYRKKGYAAEAVKALCDFALNRSDVKAVEAETEQGNLASEGVLLKIGFTRTGRNGKEGARYILCGNL